MRLIVLFGICMILLPSVFAATLVGDNSWLLFPETSSEQTFPEPEPQEQFTLRPINFADYRTFVFLNEPNSSTFAYLTGPNLCRFFLNDNLLGQFSSGATIQYNFAGGWNQIDIKCTWFSGKNHRFPSVIGYNMPTGEKLSDLVVVMDSQKRLCDPSTDCCAQNGTAFVLAGTPCEAGSGTCDFKGQCNNLDTDEAGCKAAGFDFKPLGTNGCCGDDGQDLDCGAYNNGFACLETEGIFKWHDLQTEAGKTFILNCANNQPIVLANAQFFGCQPGEEPVKKPFNGTVPITRAQETHTYVCTDDRFAPGVKRIRECAGTQPAFSQANPGTIENAGTSFVINNKTLFCRDDGSMRHGGSIC